MNYFKLPAQKLLPPVPCLWDLYGYVPRCPVDLDFLLSSLYGEDWRTPRDSKATAQPLA